MTFFKTFCGISDLQNGVIIITAISLLNKFSGFFGISSIIYDGNILSNISYLYSMIITIVFAYCLFYGILKENATIIRCYSYLYWADLVVSSIFALTFELIWYLVKDHTSILTNHESFSNNTQSILESPTKLPIWQAESIIANLILAFITFVHIYFALIVHSYARLEEKRYSIIRTSEHSTPIMSTLGITLLKPPSPSITKEDVQI
ncbi:Inositolphosphorylceramide synthase subunit Kei1-domain-containing protein [Gigaspora rosea]|uniref:Inositolphosphorylceramide synthase subunit Kei1-domain-containing protein n=1 Tax=Gigaspora rosea TaxID=44941 RepID=A0A397UV10_9GLOM|nr:Inositolphosphorylceramide synthase subunit Kei1-domain-containing protein [Gigaspora rosea]